MRACFGCQAGRSVPVNKNDAQFVNVFSLVIGILVAVALALLFLARQVAAHTEVK